MDEVEQDEQFGLDRETVFLAVIYINNIYNFNYKIFREFLSF